MQFGLAWLRRRQRALTKGVLALFCAAWLQAAIVPCVMAHGESGPVPEAAAVHADHDAHAGHDHAGAAVQASGHVSSGPCLYCPPGPAGDSDCEGHGGCAYPHDPQVDARAGAILAAVPVSFYTPLPGVTRSVQRRESYAADAVPRIPLSVSYCRFLE